MRNLVRQEIRRRDDEPMSRIFELVRSRFYQGTALSRPILGTDESVLSLQQQDFKDFWQSRYQPNNTMFSIAGNSTGIMWLNGCKRSLVAGKVRQYPQELSNPNPPRALY